MTLKEKIIFGAVVVVVAIIAVLGVQRFVSPAASFGSVGNLLAENYIAYVRTNGGYNSADPIQTSSTFSAAGATLTGDLQATTATFSATTTMADTVNFTNPAICINLYATSTATQLHIVASTTPTLPNGAAAVLTLQYGACAN